MVPTILCISIIFLPVTVLGQAYLGNLTVDVEKQVVFGSDVTFSLIAQQYNAIALFTWIYDTNDVATVQNTNGAVTTSSLTQRVSARYNLTNPTTIILYLDLFNVTLQDNSKVMVVESGPSLSNTAMISVTECETNNTANVTKPLDDCGFGCSADLTCSYFCKNESITVSAVCQRDATWSKYPVCEEITCRTNDLKKKTFELSKEVCINDTVPITTCGNKSFKKCNSSGHWENFCETGSSCALYEVECNGRCTIESRNLNVPFGTRVTLKSPRGRFGTITALYLETGFYNVEGDHYPVNCSNPNLTCGEKQCSVPPGSSYGYNETVNAVCPQGFNGTVTAICGDNNIYEAINAFCEPIQKEHKSEIDCPQDLIFGIIFGIFGGAFICGCVVGFVMDWSGEEPKQEEFSLNLKLSKLKLVLLIIGFVVWGFALGFLLSVCLAQCCKKNNQDHDDYSKRDEHHTTTY